LRANKNDELAVIKRALDETRKEIKSKDVDVKAAAVLKLIYASTLTAVAASALSVLNSC
jgi:AP-3 complex subunit delta-1